MSKFKMPKNIIVPKAIVEKTGEEVLTVAFDLGLETGEQPLAMVFQKCEGETTYQKTSQR